MAYLNQREVKTMLNLSGYKKESIKKKYFINSSTHTNCPWKGEASYYSIEVDGIINPDAAWYYPKPQGAAIEIKDRVAFWKGVTISS